jgi:hypothetical protein
MKNQYYTLLKQFTLLCSKNNNKPSELHNETLGFTILEVIATTVMGLLIIGGGFGGFIMVQQIVGNDRHTADINQRLTTALSTMGPDIQQMGEGLVNNTQIPVLKISQRIILGSTVNKTSDITIKRTLLPLTLSVCAQVDSGTSNAVTVMSENDPNNPTDPNPNASCQPSQNDNDPEDDWPDNVRKWQEKRVSEGGTVSAYIFNGDQEGEFFDYTGEEVGTAPLPGQIPDTFKLTTDGHTWENTYPINSSIYLIDERTYKVTSDGKLQLITKTGESFDITEGIDRLEITAILQKVDPNNTTEYKCKIISATSTDCGIPDYRWSDVKYIEVKVVAIDPTDNPDLVRNKPGQRSNLTPQDLTMTQKFLPRNRLSF